MAINAKDVMDLRQKTGLGMMECKAALAETDGDVSKAIDLLRQKSLGKMDLRADRSSAEGRIGSVVTGNKTQGAITEINTETDFTANSDPFRALVLAAQEGLKQPVGEMQKTDAIQKLIDDVRITTKENVQFARGRILGGQADRRVGTYVHFNGKVGALVEVELAPGSDAGEELLKEICQHIVAAPIPPMGVVEADIPAEIVEKEKQIAKAQAIEQGKPEQIAEKMVIGKVRKFYEDHCLLLQLFIKDDKKRIKDILPKGVTIKAFTRYQIGGR